MSCETCAAACPAAKGARTSGGQGAGVAVALLGQPNSGKSTLFNGLTGARQHVGNWPGKTVERKEGSFGIGDTQCRVVDLPGAYGLSANSPEEEVTRDYLESGDADVVVVMADASQLERSLYMLAEFAAAHPEQPSLLALNLMDVAEGQGKRIDSALIEQRLGIPVVPLVRKGSGICFAPSSGRRASAHPLTTAACVGSWRPFRRRRRVRGRRGSPGSNGSSTGRCPLPRKRTRCRVSTGSPRALAGPSPSPSP
mgnify:CR=1 FL=1